MNYLDWIDEQISRHLAEIDRLNAARSVIEEAGSNLRHAEMPKLLAKPKVKPKVKQRHRNRGETRSKIVNAITALGTPSEPQAINAHIRAEHPEVTLKMLHNALYNMRIGGHVVRDKQGLYGLPEPVRNNRRAA